MPYHATDGLPLWESTFRTCGLIIQQTFIMHCNSHFAVYLRDMIPNNASA
jgi:hypothetical protein